MSKIKVLLISHTCQSLTEGQPKAEMLAKMPDIELCVLTPDRWKHYGSWRAADPVDPARYNCRIGKVAMPWVGPAQFYLHWYPELKSLITSFQPDIIDLWEEPWGLVSVQACRLRRYAPGVKIISETEQNINKTLPFPFEAFRAHTLKQADYVVGRNRESLDILKLKGYQGPGEVVPNAVDDTLFNPMDRAECRKVLGVEGFVVGYIGRLVEAKGLADLVDALALCPADVNAVFVGSGEFEGALRRHAESAGVASRISILDARPLTELPVVMNAIDVLALPSRTTPSWKEQFGRVIIEAHACKTPVLGSSSGAIPEVVGTGGMVFREGDPEDLAQCIVKMRNDASCMANMGQAGFEAVKARYTWKRVAEQMSNIYRNVAARK